MTMLDCHNHTAEWSDGRQSIEQVLERGRETGIAVGVADHAGLGDYLNSNDRLLAYADYLTQYPVARGLEMDLGKSFSVKPGMRTHFDYMIASVHGVEVNGTWLSFSRLIKFLKGDLQDYNPLEQIGDPGLFFKAHLDILKKEFTAQKYDILGHCTMLPPLGLGDPEKVFPEWWEDDLIAVLLHHGVAIEISNRWRTPYERLMKKAVEAGAMFSLGSDGHEPKRSCLLDFPKEMIVKFNLPEDRIFNVPRLMTEKDKNAN